MKCPKCRRDSKFHSSGKVFKDCDMTVLGIYEALLAEAKEVLEPFVNASEQTKEESDKARAFYMKLEEK